MQLFYSGDTFSPQSVLGSDKLVSAVPLMEFAASASSDDPNLGRATITVGAADSSSFDASNLRSRHYSQWYL